MQTPPQALRKALREYFAALGRKGGKARLTKLTPEQRVRIARKAARARWSKRRQARRSTS